MNFEKNKRYFANKKLPMLIGGGLLAVGIVFLLMRGSWDFDPSLVGIPLALIGAVVFFADRMRTARDSQLDEAIAKKRRYTEEKEYEKYDLYERQLSYINHVLTEQYIYTEDSLIKRDGNGKYRSDRYSIVNLYFVESELIYVRQEFSFVEEYELIDDAAVPYASIGDVSVEEVNSPYKYGKKDINIRHYRFTVKDTEGNIILSCPTTFDAAMDECVKDIMKLAEKARAEA